MEQVDMKEPEGISPLINGAEDSQLGMYDQRLPCFGCGIGWFSYYRKDPRERAGLEACAVVALICTVALFIIVAVIVLRLAIG